MRQACSPRIPGRSDRWFRRNVFLKWRHAQLTLKSIDCGPRARIPHFFPRFCFRFSLYPEFRYLPECPPHGNLLRVDWRVFSKVFRNLGDAQSHTNIQPQVDLARVENIQMSEESSRPHLVGQGRTKRHRFAGRVRPEFGGTDRSLRDLIEGLGVIVWEADPTMRQFHFVSPHAEGLLGYSIRRWLAEPGFWLNHIVPEDRDRVVSICNAAASGEMGEDFECRMFAADGRRVWLRNILQVVRDEDGRILLLRGLMVETTEQKLNEEALRESRLRLQLITEQVPAILWSTDAELRVTYLAGKSLPDLHLDPRQIVGSRLSEYSKTGNSKLPPISLHHKALEGQSISYEVCSEGRTYQEHLEPLRNASGIIVGSLGVALDVTERKRAEEQARYLSVTDPLTGLANYRRLLDVLSAEIQRSGRTGRPFALLFFDLDRLKSINDKYGHLVGSRALCRLGNVLRVCSRVIDTPARYGGDEFALVLPETERASAKQVSQRIAERVRQELEEPSLSASVGVAIYPRDGNTIERLFAVADKDLYSAKAAKSRT